MSPDAAFSTVVLVGFGRIAEVLYAPFLAQHCRSVIVCEPDSARHAAVRAALPHARIERGAETLGKAPGDACLALNLVPGPNHAATNSALLRSGWHVFSEKPAAPSADAWRTLLGEASVVSRALVSAPVSAYLPEVEELRRAILDRSLGRVSEVHATFFAGGPARRGFVDEGRTWFFGADSCVIRDLGPYVVAPLVRLLGAPLHFGWHRNAIYEPIQVRPTGTIVPMHGSAAVGVGQWREAIATISLAYRPGLNDTVAQLTVVGTSGTRQVLLDQPPRDGVHADTKVALAFELVQRALRERAFRMRHSYDVAQTLSIIQAVPPPATRPGSPQSWASAS